MKPKKAAGYIRVSTYGQKENESLPIQRESIKTIILPSSSNSRFSLPTFSIK